MTVDSKHRLKTNLTREIYNVTDKTEPVVLVDIDPLTFAAAQNCLSAHWGSFFHAFKLLVMQSREVDGDCRPESCYASIVSGRKKKLLTCEEYSTGATRENVTIRLPLNSLPIADLGVSCLVTALVHIDLH